MGSAGLEGNIPADSLAATRGARRATFSQSHQAAFPRKGSPPRARQQRQRHPLGLESLRSAGIGAPGRRRAFGDIERMIALETTTRSKTDRPVS